MSKEIIAWDLSLFYKNVDDPEIEKDMKKIEELALQFNKEVKGKLTDKSLSSSQLKEWYKKIEAIYEKILDLDLFSSYLYSTTSLDDTVKALHSKVEEFRVKIEEQTMFFELDLNKISDKKYEEFLNSEELSNYNHHLKFNRQEKPHQLSEKEELIIQLKDLTGARAFNKLSSELSSSFTYEFEVEGEKKTLPGPELFAYMYHKDKEVRYRALRLYLSKYEENELVFTHIYNNVLKNWVLETKKRNYSTPISRRNLRNEISDKTVEVLGDVTTKNNTLVERYYNIKKKIINLPELRMSDMYAPVGEASLKYTYEEAIEIIKEAVQKFNPELVKITEELVKRKHIDVTPRKGKEGGAFCGYSKQKEYPFVFVNFTGDIDSALTLAHELGHAYHHYYIQQKQTMINIGSALPVAEIASVFNEILTFDHFMSMDLSKEDKIALLANNIESNFATSHRQNAFYRFEKYIHDLLDERLPTTKDLKEAFTKEMKLMFGNSITNIDEDYSSYIFTVPHFLNVPFYVYAYNMSNLLVIALYQLYLEQKEEFIPKYMKLLTVGRSLTPEEMLAKVGIDLSDPSFWQKGMDYLSKQIDLLEELV
ncbi:MAG: M3 family oligoendopeptidase [Candidatus Thorarchaeota archaeon]